jgi:hypothetical protein
MKESLHDFEMELQKSEKFLKWSVSTSPEPRQEQMEVNGKLVWVETSNIDGVEKHYAPSEIADAWGVSVDLIRDIFRKEPGVLALDRTGKGKYITMRVPESVMERVHRRLSQG